MILNGGVNMYILTSITRGADRVRIYDTADDTNDEMQLKTVVENMDALGRIYGLRKVDQSSFFPPDAKFIPGLGVCIIPSESKEAMLRYRQSQM